VIKGMALQQFPLHPAQREVFIDQLLHIDSTQYNIGVQLILKGKLDVEKLREAVASLPEVFDAYKMRFDYNSSEFVYQYEPDFERADLKQVDFSRQENPEHEAMAWIRHQVSIAFVLTANVLPFEHTLIKVADTEHWLFLKYHHLVSDGYGFIISTEYIGKKYNSLVSGSELVLPPTSYQQEIVRANEYVNSARYKDDEAYWMNKLPVKPAKLFAKKYKLADANAPVGDNYNIVITPNQRIQLDHVQAVCNTGLHQLTIAALLIYLGNILPDNEFVLGIPVHKRGSKQLRNTVGMFSGAIPFKGNFNADQTLTELLADIIASQKADYRHYNYHAGDLSRSFNIQSAQDHLYDVIVNYEPLNFHFEFGNGINASIVRIPNEGELVPLQLCWRDYGEHQPMQLQFQFCYEYFSQQEIELLAERFFYIIIQFCTAMDKRVGDIDIIPAKERDLLSAFSVSPFDINKTASADKTVISVFEQQAANTPEATAVVFENEIISYNELNQRSNQLASYLQLQGVTTETLVPVCIERSIEMIVGILGIIKAGAAYVPIDAEYPEDRINYILEDIKASIILSSSASKNKLQNGRAAVIELDTIQSELVHLDSSNLNISVSGGQLAYVIYTSGSTGKPKGVMIEHGGVVNLAASQAEALRLKPGMRTLQFSSFGFDASCYEIFNTLLSAGCLVMCNKDALLSTESFSELVNKHKVELAVIPPSFQQVVVNVLGTIKTIVSAGEPLNAAVGERIQWQGTRLINAYGPTESTVCATLTDEPIRIDGVMVIGKPISNTTIHIVNDLGELSPVGIYGEICIGGAQVARGYLNQPELTAEKFIADIYSEEASARLYKTGDIGRWLADGNIEYLGRKDDQVKVRGYRIELGEIESVLQQSSLVKHAVVLAKDDQQGNKRLVAYVTVTEEANTTVLQQYLQNRLPEYMVPRQWVEMESFPLTPNGKIDKRALPDADHYAIKRAYVAPRTETEAQLAAIWQELLGIEKVGIHDNFFELGGHSLLGMRVLSHFRREHGGGFSIRDVFNYPTIAELSQQVQVSEITAAIIAGERPAYIPLSYSQERLWFIDRLEGSIAYHVPGILRLSGKPDVAALESAFRSIVDRHEVLRAVIKEYEGEGYQLVMPKGDWQLKETQIEGNLDNYISTAVQTPFDLSHDAMLRCELIGTNTGEHLLLLVMHHIASDGWSMPVLVSEFIKLYAAHQSETTAVLPQLNIQYADYAIWQRKTLQGSILDNKLSYWKEKLTGVSALQLPTDHTRPAVQTNHGAIYEFQTGKDITDKLYTLSLENGATLYMTLLSVFKVMLYRYSSQQDICVGSPVANREQAEVAELIGFFVNTLALRSTVTGNETFYNLLQQIKQTTLEAYEHQDVPFEKVVEAVVKERDRGRSPLFQVLFVLQNTPAIPVLELGDIHAEATALTSETAKYELTLNIQETAEGLKCSIEYNTDLYERETIIRMAGHYQQLLASVSGSPDVKVSHLSMLGTAGQTQLQQFNATTAAYLKESNIVAQFEMQAQATPNATAVICANETISYEELNERANQLAHYLQKAGVSKETLVPVCMERGTAMLVSILAILKAGGAYVPVDMDYPAARIGYIFADTKAQVILCSAESREKLSTLINDQTLIDVTGEHQAVISAENKSDINISVQPDQLAYIIYTSGSTGTPKGVMVEHGNVISLVKNAGYVTTGADDTLLVTGSPAFDATTFEYWSMLLNGGRLLLAGEQELANNGTLKTMISEYGVSIMWFTSSWFNQLTDDSPEVFEGLTRLLVGGERLSAPHIKKIRSIYPDLQLINGYGPTENTTFSLTWPITQVNEEGLIPIGSPLNNRTAYVLDAVGGLCPIGIPGEICLGGAGVSRGYLNASELTNEKFVNDIYSTAPNARLYKTGDIGRWLADGTIEYLGRKDDQVQIRGYRIELGEIENVLLQSGLVQQAVVLARADQQGNKRLTAYVTIAGEYDREALQKHLQTRLPEYMVPRQWVQLKSFPLTSNGKIDKQALPDAELLGQNAYEAPQTDTEIKLATIWQELLAIEKVGIHDNFFELGGHSLLGMRVVHYIERELAVSVPISIVFQFATISGLGKYVAIRQGNNIINQDQSFKIVDL
jgi:amino acid adenylation domain-containing protein